MNHSKRLYQEALKHIPGGVNSPVRSFNGVGTDHPIFISAAKGAYVYDADNKRYIDYIGSWGPMILGHANPEIIANVTERLAMGLSFGAPTEIEVQLANKINAIMPNIEKVRMVNSGTEATMSAIRLARGFTGRDKILKFNGCYHGHADTLLVKAGSGVLTFGLPGTPGVPEGCVADTLTAEFNDLENVENIFKEVGDQIAAIIVEPVACNMNCVPPNPEFLQGLRKICDEYNSVLIFDEVITGFRVALGGAQALYNIKPDLTTLGKIIGGGMPVGAFGGRADIMDHIAPTGPVYQAGTLSGNPIAMTAGLTGLEILERMDPYAELEKKTAELIDGLQGAANEFGIAMRFNQVGSLFGLYFNENEIIDNFDKVKQSDAEMFKKFFKGMLEEGIHFAPSPFESAFVSVAHTDTDIQDTINAARTVFAKL